MPLKLALDPCHAIGMDQVRAAGAVEERDRLTQAGLGRLSTVGLTHALHGRTKPRTTRSISGCPLLRQLHSLLGALDPRHSTLLCESQTGKQKKIHRCAHKINGSGVVSSRRDR